MTLTKKVANIKNIAQKKSVRRQKSPPVTKKEQEALLKGIRGMLRYSKGREWSGECVAELNSALDSVTEWNFEYQEICINNAHWESPASRGMDKLLELSEEVFWKDQHFKDERGYAECE